MIAKKQKVPAMLPVKEWLSLEEAMSYVDMSKNTFLDTAIKNHLTVTTLGKKRYFKVSQINEMLERNTILN